MRSLILGVVIAGLGSAPLGAWAQLGPPEAASIVLIVTIDPASGHIEEAGTGFIVSPSGIVVTVSHIVRQLKEHPGRFRLLVLTARPPREFFTADLVCATRLPEGAPGPSVKVPFAKDAALLKITLPTTLQQTWGIPLPGGQRYEWVRHDGPMPEWPALRIATRGPAEGELIHATGYSRHLPVLPFLSTASGQVEGTLIASDGTPLFGIRFINPSGPGSSGSPVLNTAGEVVGLIAWGDVTNPSLGVAQDVSVVRHPCP